MLDAGELLEWTTYCGHNYGTLRAPVERQMAQGNDVLLDIDARGAAQVRDSLRGVVSVFVLPPDIVELERRIRNRGCASEDELATRLNQARIELAAARQYDYVVVNKSMPGAIEAVISIVRAERCRTPRVERVLGFTREGDGAC
jgi:guanylate kinase